MFHRDTTAEVVSLSTCTVIADFSGETCATWRSSMRQHEHNGLGVPGALCSLQMKGTVAPHGMKLNGEKKSNFKQVVWSSLKCSILRQAYKSADAV